MNITHTHTHVHTNAYTTHTQTHHMHIIKLCTLYVCLNTFKKEDGHRPDGRALLEYRSIGLNTGKMISRIIGVWA